MADRGWLHSRSNSWSGWPNPGHGGGGGMPGGGYGQHPAGAGAPGHGHHGYVPSSPPGRFPGRGGGGVPSSPLHRTRFADGTHSSAGRFFSPQQRPEQQHRPQQQQTFGHSHQYGAASSSSPGRGGPGMHSGQPARFGSPIGQQRDTTPVTSRCTTPTPAPPQQQQQQQQHQQQQPAAEPQPQQQQQQQQGAPPAGYPLLLLPQAPPLHNPEQLLLEHIAPLTDDDDVRNMVLAQRPGIAEFNALTRDQQMVVLELWAQKYELIWQPDMARQLGMRPGWYSARLVRRLLRSVPAGVWSGVSNPDQVYNLVTNACSTVYFGYQQLGDWQDPPGLTARVQQLNAMGVQDPLLRLHLLHGMVAEERAGQQQQQPQPQQQQQQFYQQDELQLMMLMAGYAPNLVTNPEARNKLLTRLRAFDQGRPPAYWSQCLKVAHGTGISKCSLGSSGVGWHTEIYSKLVTSATSSGLLPLHGTWQWQPMQPAGGGGCCSSSSSSMQGQGQGQGQQQQCEGYYSCRLGLAYSPSVTEAALPRVTSLMTGPYSTDGSRQEEFTVQDDGPNKRKVVKLSWGWQAFDSRLVYVMEV